MSVVIGNEPEEGDEKKKSSLVEDARAAVRAARRKQLEEIRAARRKAVKAEQDWDDYQDILFCNLPTRLAQREGVTSFSPAMQTVFIDKADMELRQQRLSQRLKTTEADPALQKVMKLQNTQGFWELTPGLVDAVGGMFPDTPPGIVDWRWATACALAFLRRRPDQHSFLQHVHDKGVDWVQPPWLLKVRIFLVFLLPAFNTRLSAHVSLPACWLVCLPVCLPACLPDENRGISDSSQNSMSIGCS